MLVAAFSSLALLLLESGLRLDLNVPQADGAATHSLPTAASGPCLSVVQPRSAGILFASFLKLGKLKLLKCCYRQRSPAGISRVMCLRTSN